MRTDDFDFELPRERIALEPCQPRDAARMLVVRPSVSPHDVLEDRTVRDLPDLLNPGDLLVVNDTRVLKAALNGTRRRDADDQLGVHINLVRQTDPATWLAFAKPGRRLKTGDRIEIGAATAVVGSNSADGLVTLQLDMSGEALAAAIDATGQMPLPPYIQSQRPANARDLDDYQTVFASVEGAVASPTAALHFTEALLDDLDRRGIGRATLTLHVGAGTFLPVKTDDPNAHHMHSEWFEISPETAEIINEARANGGRIIAVGTTVIRALETAVRPDGTIAPMARETDIFLKPGHRFQSVDALMTNFHLPRSTLFMLVAAFAGLETMRAAYAQAVARAYRFYSYGDSSLLFPKDPRP